MTTENIMRIRLAVVLGTLCLFLASSFVAASDYAHELEDKDMAFAWKVDGDNLLVKMSAKTEGWVGIGFNPTEKMKDANFVLGYVKKGKAKIIDEYGTSKTAHKNDEKLGGTTDAVLINGTEEGGVTTIEFSMPLKTDDKNDQNLDVDANTIVLLAYGSGRDSFKSKHKYRGTFNVNLGSGEFTKVGK